MYYLILLIHLTLYGTNNQNIEERYSLKYILEGYNFLQEYKDFMLENYNTCECGNCSDKFISDFQKNIKVKLDDFFSLSHFSSPQFD